MTKTAPMTGLTGQDGSCLAQLLISKGLRGPRQDPALLHVLHRADRRPLPRPSTDPPPTRHERGRAVAATFDRDRTARIYRARYRVAGGPTLDRR
jgi:hypothetical protein